jgi:CubicO group peptidase (beta-lactamase class C family)
MLIIRRLVELLRQVLCPRDNKMKTPMRQILHCTAGSRAGRLLAAVLSLAMWTSTAAANQAASIPAPSPDKLERITEFFNNKVATGKLPGAVILIQQHGRPAYLKCFGVQDVETKTPMSSDTIFALHSMTKPITSVAAMMLIDAGKLSLADSASKFIPAFADVKVGVASAAADGTPFLKLVPPDRPVTIEDLLRHTSGITYDCGKLIDKAYKDSGLFDGRYNNKVFAERIARLPLARQPGTLWRYGHSTDVLGRIIEIVSGQTLYQFEKQHIFDPLGMTSTKYVLETAGEHARMAEPLPNDTILNDSEAERRAHPEWESGGGGLVSTLNDYARFAQMILNGGEFDGKRYLSPAAFRAMTSDHVGPTSGVARDYFYFPGDGFGYGYGLGVRTDPGNAKPPPPGSIGELKWDSGSGTYFGVDPHLNMIYIMLEQTQNERGRILPAFKKLVYDAFATDN